MNKCLLCLKMNENYQNITIFNSCEWLDLNIQDVIEKHFWKLENLNNLSYICKACWQELYNFHNFYSDIKKAHSDLNTLSKTKIFVENIESEKEKVEKVSNDDKNNSELEPEVLFIREEDSLEIFEKEEVESLISIKRNSRRKCSENRSASRKKELGENILKKISKSKDSDNEINKLKANKNPDDIKSKNLEKDTEEPKIECLKETCFDRNDGSIANADDKLDDKLDKRDIFLTENFQITCTFCQLSLPTFYTLRKHCKEEHNQRGYVVCCNAKFYTRAEIFDHVNFHQNPDLFKCKYCDKILNRRFSLKLHIRNVHEQRTIDCDICGKKLTKTSIKHHKFLHDDKAFPCKECDKTFSSEFSFKKHMQYVHLKKTHVCDLCGKSIARHRLKRHMLEHEGKDKLMVSCEVCGRRLSDIGCLKRHMDSHHPPKESQTEFNCPKCTKVFGSSQTLKEHIWVTHENRYSRKCKLCGKTFKRPGTLHDHMARHTGKPLRACGFCPKMFYSSGNMHSHRKRDHPEEWQKSIKEKFSGNLPEKYVTKS